MTCDSEDYRLDLLFSSRSLQRLTAVELKVGRFKPSSQGQMSVYLKWLDRHELQGDEDLPIGLILCAATSRAEIGLIEPDKEGIVVAECWTTLPPKAELQAIYWRVQEWIARRQLTSTAEERGAER